MNKIAVLLIACCLIGACKQEEKTTNPQKITPPVEAKANTAPQDSIEVIPVEHASFMMKFQQQVIFVDPVQTETFLTFPKADLILITDIHPDHLQPETIKQLTQPNTIIIAPEAVAKQLPEAVADNIQIMDNAEQKSILGMQIEAIPMYNLREEAKQFHPKGRGNGYVLEANEQRIYISGDTEDIPEMRQLKAIDIAFVCMNLPYTMPVETAADAVLAFKPKRVYPYHFRGTEGLSDVRKFTNMVTTNNPAIEVIRLDWYPKL